MKYRTGALLGSCAKYALIREMCLIKSTFFNAGILRTAAKYALNSEYAPISDMRLITRRYGISFVDVKLIKMLFLIAATEKSSKRRTT